MENGGKHYLRVLSPYTVNLNYMTRLWTCAPSDDPYQPALSLSLIRIFTGLFLEIQGCKVSSCGQRRLRSDCADAQADLSLRWRHMSEDTVSHVAAHICSPISVNCIYPKHSDALTPSLTSLKNVTTPFYFLFLCLQTPRRMENSVDPDWTPRFGGV